MSKQFPSSITAVFERALALLGPAVQQDFHQNRRTRRAVRRAIGLHEDGTPYGRRQNGARIVKFPAHGHRP